ncbi:MAG: glycosyl transferase [Lyngbya sp.]|nr:glycosyl transferase [Lyngbya sp.]
MNISPKQIAKSLHLGVVAYRLYYAPKGLIQKYLHRDPVRRAIDEQSRQQMEAATYQLKPLEQLMSDSPLEIYFLSGKKFWYQTCFCAYSMAKTAQVNLRPVIYDDGTLERKNIDEIQRLFPDSRIVNLKEIEECIEAHLPTVKFPYLRERRANYPNIRKLTDIHVGSKGWKLVLDSDMLFFRNPNFLIEWLKSPQIPCHMVDVETCYGYSNDLMTSLAQAEIAERLNVGICGLKSEEIDWEKLEFWCRTMIEKEGTHYYQEQAIIAMLMAGQACAVAPADEYIVMPNRQEVIAPKAVLHHYVSDSKPWYFRYGWQHILNSQVL